MSRSLLAVWWLAGASLCGQGGGGDRALPADRSRFGVQMSQARTAQAYIDPRTFCRLEGRTLSAATGEPLPRVTLTLTASGGGMPARSGKSDNDGRFLIEDVAPGVYRLIGERPGFLRQGYGARTPGGTGAPLKLTEGLRLTGLVLRLTPQGVITGRVVDDEGDPAPRTMVTARRLGVTGVAQPALGRGGPQFGRASATTMTNDIGEFRVPGLPAGRYVIVATSQAFGGFTSPRRRGTVLGAPPTGVPEQALMPTFYPSTTDSTAAVPVEVSAGQEITGVSIALRKGYLYRVQGKVMGATPQDLAGVNVSLLPRGTGNLMFAGRSGAMLRPDGSFEMARVPPGSYYVLAQRLGRHGAEGIVGRALVDVAGSDIVNLLVPVTERVTVSGTVKFEADSSADLRSVSLSLIPYEAPIDTPVARVAGGGAFTMPSVLPDKYYLNVRGLPADSYVKSVRLANQEVIDKGIDLSNARSSASLDIVLSANGASVEGTVTSGGHPAIGSFVVVLPDPARPEQSYLNKSAAADQNGKFTITGLAPGSYKLYAFEEPFPELVQDPVLALPFEPQAVRLTLSAGSKKPVSLNCVIF